MGNPRRSPHFDFLALVFREIPRPTTRKKDLLFPQLPHSPRAKSSSAERPLRPG